MELKGFAAPVAAWRVRGEGAIESRFEALHSTAALAPLVGREEEIELLLRGWTQAKEGEGRVLLLTGEPGIGKSRLSVALQERLLMSRMSDCTTPARHTTRTALSTRQSCTSNEPPGLSATTCLRPNSTS